MRPHPRTSHARIAAVLIVLLLPLAGCGAGAKRPKDPSVTLELSRPVNSFAGGSTIGAGVDGHGPGDIPAIYTPANLRAMLSTGLGPLTYRLRTELGSEAWHFNPVGRFSDARRAQGYWISSDRPGPPTAVTYGYRLPRRGDTIDQANNDGYSRIDDGSARTYWKSNPYLDSTFTGESDAQHPQWAEVDLGRPRPVTAVSLEWANPYASSFRVQYWVGPDPPWRNGAEDENARFTGPLLGRWFDFPRGQARGHPGRQDVVLASRAFTVRYVRVLMIASSHTAPAGSRDIRDGLGYALGELGVRWRDRGTWVDWVRHAPSRTHQSIVWVSSTDPWHRASDLDPNTVQPSFQRVLSSGLTRGRPLLVPVPVAYGTPPDAAAELRYLRALHVPVRRVELGQEPDGQLLGPEDYGALYEQFAGVLHHTAPAVTLGGPSLATAVPDWTVAPDADGNRSWTSRFLAQLRRRGALGELGFFSFEWYPFDNLCARASAALRRAPVMLDALLARERADGLPDTLPKIITEYGYSPFAAQPEVDLVGGVLDADVAARFLALGGRGAYLYGYEPDTLMREPGRCPTYGNLLLYLSDDAHRIQHPVASELAMHLLTTQWLAPGAGRQELFAAADTLDDPHARPLISAYPLRRPDGRLSILLLNRDADHAHRLTVRLSPGGLLRGPLDLYSLSGAQYVWHPRGAHGYPAPAAEPAHLVLTQTVPVTLTLPALSLNVVRTRSPPPAAG